MRVHPTMIPNSSMLSKVDGVMNAISVVGDRVGETLFTVLELEEMPQPVQ